MKNTMTCKGNTYLMFKRKNICFIFFLSLISSSIYAQFVHPGICHKKSDLERAKYAIQAGQEPWSSSFENLQADPLSSYNYLVRGNPSWTVVSRNNINHIEYENDMQAAYLNALMYWYTEDQRHADKAIEILNTWSNLTYVAGIPLNVGLYGAPLINAAELIKHSNAGWEEADIQKFSDMLVHPGYSNTTVPQADIDADNYTFYWGVYNGDPKRAGNQELAAYKTMIAIGVFLDNEIIYDRAVRYVSGQAHRPDDLPYEAGPKTSTTIISENPYRISYNWTQSFTTPDYGYDGVITNYIYENGQAQESARDQVHALYGVSLTAQIAEVAWNQGDDLYGLANNRILLGLEYGARYNLSYLQPYPDQTSSWEPTVSSGEFLQRNSRTARTFNKQICPVYENDVDRLSRGGNIDRPYWEQPLQHYKNRLNLDASFYKWTERTRDYNVASSGTYEVRSESPTDSPGWGMLNFGRVEDCPGDPITGFDVNGLPLYKMNVLPMTIEAENFDYFVTDGQDKSYHDATTSTLGGVYRTDESVDLKGISGGEYVVSNIEDQEWLSYTVFVPADGTYDVSINYASVNANGNIKINIGGVDVTEDISIPFGSPNSTGITDWKDFTIASNVPLTKGVQALKFLFSGTNNSFELNNLTIDINTLEEPMGPGEFEFLFDTDNDFEGWGGFNNPGTTTMAVASGELQATYLATNGYLGVQHQADLEFSVDHPYVAIKIDHLPTSRMSFYMANGWYNNDKGGFSSLANTALNNAGIYVYDLSVNGPGFGSAATQIFGSGENYIDTNRIIFLIDDGDTGGTYNATYNDIDWIKNFATVDDIIEYAGLTLGNDDLKHDLISIYPNPVKNNFKITNSLGADIEIYNIMGKLLIKNKIENSEQSIDISNLISGIYFVVVKNNNEIITNKIIKK